MGAALAAVAVAGCGASKREPPPRKLSVEGASFLVPADWKLGRSLRGASARSGDDLVSVQIFRLRRRYDPSLFPRVTKELDEVAAQLAKREHAEVAKSETVEVAGRRTRAYTLDRGDRHERIGFVLAGRREYQLLCRYGDAPAAACDTLFASFALG